MSKIFFKTGIYKIENILNHKVYIGKSSNIEKRWQKHKSPSYRQEKSQAIHKAIDKYGIENFIFSILEECSLEDIDEKEGFYIQKYNSYNDGYNCSLGGDGSSVGEAHQNAKLTEENVREIWRLRETTMTIHDIASKFNVTKCCIEDILYRRSWTHLAPNGELKRKKRSIFNEEEEEYIRREALKGTSPKIVYEKLALEGRYCLNSLYGKMWRIKKEENKYE